jgi:beta-glucosidase
MVSKFPADFIWAVATAGHQVEGNNRNSDTWFAEHAKPTVFKEPSLMACNSFELYRTDIDLVAGMNLTAYRFSVEWARIEPSEGVFDEAMLDHYEAMVDYCREKGLKAIVTFNHFTAPSWFAAKGGWLAPDAPELFGRYCGKVAERIAHKIAFAVTLNEPNLGRLLKWVGLPSFVHDLERATLEACSLQAGVPKYRLANVLLEEEMGDIEDGIAAGHVAGRKAIKAVAPELPVGFSLALMHDIVIGDDATVRDRKRAECYERWLELAKNDDFIGVQNYETHRFDANGLVKAAAGEQANGMGTVIDADSLAGAVEYVYSNVGKPVLVTEHGLLHEDDSLREVFIPAALEKLHEVLAKGVPVLGYTHWTLLDNFEWIFGYEFRYGLFAVDHQTFERIPKGSSKVYAAIALDQRS